MKNKSVLIFSGGLDSTSLLSGLVVAGDSDIYLLHFQYGSKHNAKELEAVTAIAKYYNLPSQVVDLSYISTLFKSSLLVGGEDIPEGHYEDDNMKSTVVPFRNGILLANAIGYAESIEATTVYYGAHSGDHAIYPDCRPEFYQAMCLSAKTGTYNQISIAAPFLDMGKGGVCKVGHDNKAPLHLTWTCYKGGQTHCGRCGACVERREAFQKNNITDPTTYEVYDGN